MQPINVPIRSIDDILYGQGGQNASTSGRLIDAPISDIDDHPNHPFQVKIDDDMRDLVDSVIAHGVQTPVVVRSKTGERYELISGHRRKQACIIAELTTMPAIVLELDDDEAAIALVDANLLQRKTILPSEKARSYKMRLDALRRQAGRPHKDDASQSGVNLHSADALAKITGDSRSQIHRYVRLLELIPEFLDKVDAGAIVMSVAEELTYIPAESQRVIRDVLNASRLRLNTVNAQELRRVANERTLDKRAAEAILSGKAKPIGSRPIAFKLKAKLIGKYFKPEQRADEIESMITAALDFYIAHLEQKNPSPTQGGVV